MFFAKTLPYPEGEAALAAKSHFMAKVGGRHALSSANRIIVPDLAYDDSVRILGEYGLEVPVVRLGELPS